LGKQIIEALKEGNGSKYRLTFNEYPGDIIRRSYVVEYHSKNKYKRLCTLTQRYYMDKQGEISVMRPIPDTEELSIDNIFNGCLYKYLKDTIDPINEKLNRSYQSNKRD